MRIVQLNLATPKVHATSHASAHALAHPLRSHTPFRLGETTASIRLLPKVWQKVSRNFSLAQFLQKVRHARALSAEAETYTNRSAPPSMPNASLHKVIRRPPTNLLCHREHDLVAR